MILETRAVPPFMKNGFVLGCEETREGVVIDPGDDVDLLLAAVARHKLSIRYILLTHAHLDHITGVGRAREALGAPVVLHRDDNVLYEAVVQQGQMFGFDVDPQPPVDRFYDGPGPWTFGRYAAWVHHTPGHCPGRRLPRGRPRATAPSGRSLSAIRCSRVRLAGRICLAAACRRSCGRSERCSSASLTTRSSIQGTARRRRSARSDGRIRSWSDRVLSSSVPRRLDA